MKFGKCLSNQIEQTLPEWRDKFISYKDLKKRLNSISGCDGEGAEPGKRRRLDRCGAGEGSAAGVSMEELEFVRVLEDELEKFNAFFVEKEEDYIIKLKVPPQPPRVFCPVLVAWIVLSVGMSNIF